MAWRNFLNRSIEQFREESIRVLRATPIQSAEASNTLPILSIRNGPADLSNWAIGSDSDIGGASWCKLESYPLSAQQASTSVGTSASAKSDSDSTGTSVALKSPGPNEDGGKGRFYGALSSKVRQGMKLGGNKVDRSGYAGIRSKSRPSLFGHQMWDTSQYTFLKIRVKPSPDEGMRYFVNIQTDGPVRSDLFQHRLWLGQPGVWQDVLVPFSDFALTNTGTMSETQIEMYREKVRTVGISVLGPGEGPFELGIESFDCVNVEGREEADYLLDENRKKQLAAADMAYVMSKEGKSGL